MYSAECHEDEFVHTSSVARWKKKKEKKSRSTTIPDVLLSWKSKLPESLCWKLDYTPMTFDCSYILFFFLLSFGSLQRFWELTFPRKIYYDSSLKWHWWWIESHAIESSRNNAYLFTNNVIICTASSNSNLNTFLACNQTPLLRSNVYQSRMIFKLGSTRVPVKTKLPSPENISNHSSNTSDHHGK